MQTSFFLEILKAVCLLFDWVPKLIQICFQAIEQKLVQRCQTKVDADACKASYGLGIAALMTVQWTAVSRVAPAKMVPTAKVVPLRRHHFSW